MKTITLARQRVAATATIPGGPMANACLEISSVPAVATRELMLRLEATLYGREAVRESTTRTVTRNVFDPEHIPLIPATWWDHLIHDIGWWLARRTPKGTSGWLVRWLLSHVRTVQAPQSYCQEAIPVEHVKSLMVACPHLGNELEMCKQFVMLAVTDSEPHYAVAESGDNQLGLSANADRQVREHMFRHHLAMLADRAGKVPGDGSLAILWQLDELFRRYGVGP